MEIPRRGNFKNLTGKRFGRLLVTGCTGKKNRAGNYLWLCQCDCGNEVIRDNRLLSTGRTKSCGCLRSETVRKLRTVHGYAVGATHNPTYTSWKQMTQRCFNNRSRKHSEYGARGIKVCESWRNFGNFLADMGERPAGRTIDRIDNNGNYEPGNCRWATVEQQNNNVWIEFRGEKRTITQWARRIGIRRTALSHRLRRGWSINEALGKGGAE